MRSEQEMFQTIMNIANHDNRILAAYMNGSRANPAITRDNYQDYDIVFVVSETTSFLSDPSWLSGFGQIAMMQQPDLNDMAQGINIDTSTAYGWLMLLEDGNRIDLHIETVAKTKEVYGKDSLTVPLLDKNGILPKIDPPSDKDYWIKAPTAELFAACCNNFWWCLGNVCKGINRDQLPYAYRMYVDVVHAELENMVNWYIGETCGFTLTTGAWGKYFKKYLSSELYETYKDTYPDGSYDRFWEAIHIACGLFRRLAIFIAEKMGLRYNHKEDEAMCSYIEKMRLDFYSFS